MANFVGYLLKFGTQIVPPELLKADSYSAIPYQRTELQAYRDENNLLHRVTSPNHKTKITFSTVPLTLAQKQQLQNIIASGMTSSVERKCAVTYWNDEVNCYIAADFYLPDVTYPIKDIRGNDIQYDSISYTLIQY